jgi:hypothetical protein
MNNDFIDPDFVPGFVFFLEPVINYKSLQITYSELETTLIKEKNKLLDIFEEIKKVEIPEEFSALFEDEISTGKLGIDTITAAIDLVINSKAEPDSLESALSMAKRGYSLVKNALELSMKNSEILTSSIEEIIPY